MHLSRRRQKAGSLGTRLVVGRGWREVIAFFFSVTRRSHTQRSRVAIPRLSAGRSSKGVEVMVHPVGGIGRAQPLL